MLLNAVKTLLTILLSMFLSLLETIYSIKHKNGAIRRVNVNIAATTEENYRKLRDAGIGTYILVPGNLSYKKAYEELHPTGPKQRLCIPYRELWTVPWRAGIDDVGLGVLFGLD